MCEHCEDFINGIDSGDSLPVWHETSKWLIGEWENELQIDMWLDSFEWHEMPKDKDNLAIMYVSVCHSEDGSAMATMKIPIRFCPFCGEELKVKSNT